MSIIYKIDQLCRFNNTTIAELEKNLGYSNGSLKKSSSQTVRSDRVQEIADYFNVSPTYLLSDSNYDICPVCGFAFDPLEPKESKKKKKMHRNFIRLRTKMGYFFNPIAANKKSMIIATLKNEDVPDDKMLTYYETLLLCDFTEYAFCHDYDLDISYMDFVKSQILERKHFEIMSDSVIENIANKHNVNLSSSNLSLLDQFQTDSKFMQNILSIWDLPEKYKDDVYKAVRHAKRDYQESNTVVF